ncbi:MAG: hypothetical protein V4850_37065 [Myxococcota bacterium]
MFAPLPISGPPARSIVVVLGSGLLTTFLTLLFVQWLGTQGTYPMGWYVNFIIPAGALIVGFAATSGYALGSWFGGCKLTGRVAAIVAALSFGAYLAAQFLDYLVQIDAVGLTPADIGFLAYFDEVTRAFVWEERGEVGEPLGWVGYLLRLGEVVGFVGGGALIPLILRQSPYCEPCARYYRGHALGVLPAGLKARGMLSGISKEDWAQQHEAAFQRGLKWLSVLAAAGEVGDHETWRNIVQESKDAPGGDKPNKLDSRIVLRLHACPQCDEGFVRATLMSGQGRSIQQQVVLNQGVPMEMVRELRRK